MWKTVDEWRKKKSTNERTHRKMTATDRPTNTVAARNAAFGILEKSSSLP